VSSSRADVQPGLRIHQSNRLERLAKALGERCREPAGGPLESEQIVVPNAGMGRWLSLRLADRLGVCMNVEFRLPAAFVWSAWRELLGGVPAEPDFEAALLAWRVFGLLDQPLRGPLAPLATYLAEADDLRRFELAQHVADVFDQYLVYRPDVVLRWEDGRATDASSDDERWQAELWRRLVGSSEARHRARLARELAAVRPGRARGRLPARVHVFGLPALAPLYLATFAQLAESIAVEFYLLNPCREYWSLILPDAEIARRSGDREPEDLHLESGNPLLASMGLQGRDFVDMLGEYQPEQEDLFESPGTDTLLHAIQSDILDLRARGTDGEPAIAIADDDRSVQIHACHGRMREVEVLHDQLLDLFREHPDLEPSAVRVMTPDIETYAPLIHAVFGTASGVRRIPYAVADRQPRAERPAVAAFLALLDLPRTRYDAARLLALLETEAIRKRFDLDADDLPRVTDFVRRAGIRWGIDAASRAALGLPEIPENTWRFGLDRLRLGYAMASNGEQLFAGILPSEDVEGGDAQLVAALARFAEEVFACVETLAKPRSPAEWRVALGDVLARFFDPRAAEDDLETIRTAIARIADESARAGCERPVDLALVQAELDRSLREPGSAWALLSGGVTFCTMVPMRNIPADVVCLLGMNDGAYPRSRRPPGFDLIARHPRRGDRSRRDDDRYLFLEALLSARRCFYVSYVGRSVRDNSPLSPSVVLSELEETVFQGFRRTGSDTPASVETTHPLQPFSARYFTGEEALFSYASELCAAAGAARSAAREPDARAPAFVHGTLPEAADEWRAVTLDRLLRFFRHPSRYFLKERLGVVLEEQEALIEGTEPFALDGLDLYQVRRRLVQLHLSGAASEHVTALLRAQGALPHGLVGERLLEKESLDAERLARRVAAARPATAATPSPLTIDTRLGEMQLSGSLVGVSSDGLLDYGFDDPPRERLSLWIRHLALCIAAPAGVALESRRISVDATLVLRPVAEPRRVLEDLLALYWDGLHRPLPFLPDLAWDCFQDGLGKVAGRELAPWDSYPRVAFRSRELIGDEFATLAQRIFGPMQEHATRETA